MFYQVNESGYVFDIVAELRSDLPSAVSTFLEILNLAEEGSVRCWTPRDILDQAHQKLIFPGCIYQCSGNRHLTEGKKRLYAALPANEVVLCAIVSDGSFREGDRLLQSNGLNTAHNRL